MTDVMSTGCKWKVVSEEMGGKELLLMKYFVDNLKITELILTSGPETRTSEVRYSHVRAPNDPLPPPPSCHFVSTRSGRWISQVFNQKMKQNMEIGVTAAAGIWLASGKSTLTSRFHHTPRLVNDDLLLLGNCSWLNSFYHQRLHYFHTWHCHLWFRFPWQ